MQTAGSGNFSEIGEGIRVLAVCDLLGHALRQASQAAKARARAASCDTIGKG